MKLKELFKKIQIAENNIAEWYEYWEGNVYVAFSGGKDSLAMLHIARKIYPNIQAVFCDTGLEYPSVRNIALSFDNVVRLRPTMTFDKVIEKYGYPVISKSVSGKIENIRNTKSNYIRNLRLTNYINGAGLPIKYHYMIKAPFKISDKCCSVMKKKPFHDFEKQTNKKSMIGIMAKDSIRRKKSWEEHGCNVFSMKSPQSRPLMVWDTKDVWEYILSEKIKYPIVYDQGIHHTGCMFCGFGIMFDGSPNRYEILKMFYPKIYNYVIYKLDFKTVLNFLNIKY